VLGAVPEEIARRMREQFGDPWKDIDKKISGEKQSFIGTMNVDGQKLASIVFEQGVRSAIGPNSSSTYFDSRMAHTPIDYNFARA
jgi:hypothetical protein